MNKMLLHICCAPCSTSVIERLREEYDLTLFFYNPNIEPYEEYEERLKETERFSAETGMKLIIGEYDNNAWCEAVRGYEDEPEQGKRCNICFDIRLRKTAECAARKGFDIFTTTLSVSSHKDHILINNIGSKIAEEIGVKLYEANFKRGDGFKRSLELSKVHSLKRQNYCGCLFSRSRGGVFKR